MVRLFRRADRFLRLIMSQNGLKSRLEAALFIIKHRRPYRKKVTPEFADRVKSKRKSKKHIRVKNIDDYFSKLSGE